MSNTPAYMQLKYIDNCIQQTILWMNGKAEHRNEECTVDFSCCYPDLIFNKEKRVEIGNKKLQELHERRRKLI